MIDYGLFYFASPPRTGTAWFVKACQLVGLGPGFVENSHILFSKDCRENTLKITIVRNPCDWLASCYSSTKNFDLECLTPIIELNRNTFNEFVQDYLDRIPGYFGRLLSKYTANNCMRLEDMPWAFIELMGSLGISDNYLKMCKDLRKQNVSGTIISWNQRLKKEVMKAEEKIFERYEYF